MARHEADREDLLREATALVDRVELRTDAEPDPVVVGFRRDGCGSVYFGAEPVYQFNSSGQLRRGYHGGQLLKAEAGRLIGLTRRRTANQVQLLRDEWDAQRTVAFLLDAHRRLERLRQSLAEGRFTLIGQVVTPASADTWQRDASEPCAAVAGQGAGDAALIQRIARWLESLGALTVAASPHAE
ncbi:MAG: hypothetical protein J5I93_28955 [Pirellulaceae bacterium]|nr:hypothetical protein [Pirellulaceae bacterium]